MASPKSVNKRPHRKSRLGCQICKARKIKCDEARPTCGNCIRRFPNPEEWCEYESTRATQSVAKLSGKLRLERSLCYRPICLDECASRSMELRLFHHYSTITARTLPLCEETCGINMWTQSIPCIAFTYPHIYNAILGLSALHLLTLAPTDVALRTAMYQYLDSTITHQRSEITSEITPDNSLSIFTTSILLATYTKARAIWLSPSEEKYTLPLDWFYLHAGVRQIARETLSYISDQSIRAYALEPESNSHPNMSLDPLINVPFDFFLHLWDSPSFSSERREIYTKALEYLEFIKSCIKAGESSHWIHRRLAKMPGEIPSGFVTLLEEEDPIALAILARFFALLKFLEEPWWINGTAEFEIRGLAGLVSKEWAWCMEWPVEILEIS